MGCQMHRGNSAGWPRTPVALNDNGLNTRSDQSSSSPAQRAEPRRHASRIPSRPAGGAQWIKAAPDLPTRSQLVEATSARCFGPLLAGHAGTARFLGRQAIAPRWLFCEPARAPFRTRGSRSRRRPLACAPPQTPIASQAARACQPWSSVRARSACHKPGISYRMGATSCVGRGSQSGTSGRTACASGRAADTCHRCGCR
mmetsp:Transcript_8159/g.24512  ORF Transcript_8159/g.24512 Transcript_8159/m.24512 type:complete len:200 (-) Transcript_8159:1042-1641(-)